MRVIDEQVCTDRSQSPVGCVEKGVGGQVVLWTYLLAFQHAPQVSAMFRCGEYGGVNEKYHYDNLGQLTRHSQTISGQPEWTFEYTYNQLGRQSSITYPSGKKIKYRYNNKGFMDCVIDAALGNVIWQANASDRWDNVCDFTEGDLQVAYDYDTVTGLVNGISATRNGQTILNQTYHWTSLGNLQWRTDETIDLKESFSYDGYNRLKTANGTNLSGDIQYFSQNFSFDLTGNITAKTGIASYSYDSPTNPYAVTSVQPVAGQEGLFTNQTATYTNFDKLMTLAQDGKTLSIEYDIDRQRVMQTFSDGTTTRTKRYFTPLMRNMMYTIVSKDDGKGGTKESNNREYGGFINEVGMVIAVDAGKPKNPNVQGDIISIDFPHGTKYATFHSHPSGTGEEYIENGYIKTPMFTQTPSDKDIELAGNHICYVFARRNDVVYVYNRNGVQAIIQTSAFISHTKFVKP